MLTCPKTAVSLFSSGGIGDLALRKAGYDILVSNELLADRHSVFQTNFPETLAVTGDIWTNVECVTRAVSDRLSGENLTLLFATPPCQGMSKNGRGKLLKAIRSGQKPQLDERNRLIVPAMKIAKQLQPEIVMLENVPEMVNTVIMNDEGNLVYILDYIQDMLGSNYTGSAKVVEFADYGVPQCRQRLITVFSRTESLTRWLAKHETFLPPPSHSRKGENGTKRWVTVRETIEDLPPLDAKCAREATSDIPFHRVPILDDIKYWWVSNTPQGRSAFDNQCVRCGFDRNATHTARRNAEGINQASRETPLYCSRCGELLPRPSVAKNGSRHLMRGYTSAYKRMYYDKPASALTRNLSYACSDNKLHPEQNRVLSLFEAFRLHSVDKYSYDWKRADDNRLADKTIREIIGESIPPYGLQPILDHTTAIYDGSAVDDAISVGRLF